MGYDPRRAGVTVLCVVSLLLAATLFPATGFGDYPSWSPEGIDPGESGEEPDPGPGGEATPTDGGETGPTTDAGGTTTSSTTDEGGTTTTDEGGTTTDDGETATTTTTTATTTTTTTEDDPSSAGDGSILPPILRLFELLLTTLLWGAVLLTLGAAVLGAGMALGAVSVERPSENELVLDVWGLPSVSIPIASAVQSVPQATTAFLVGIGSTLPAVLDDVTELGVGMGAGLGALLTGLGRATGQLLAGIPGALASVGSGLGSAIGGSLLAIPAGLASVATGVSNPLGKGGVLPGSDARDVADGPDADGDDDPGDRPPQSVEEAWTEMVSALPVRNRDAKTPAELARIAVSRGLPEEAVTRLTAVFREVRYGPTGSTPRHLEVARSAVERIQDSAEGE